jgi:heme A synthase
MEWLHRQWGRAIGLVFTLPLVGLVATRAVPAG